MQRWGRWVTSHARVVVGLSVALILTAALLANGVFAHLSRGGFTDPNSESAQAQQVIDQVFPGAVADVTIAYTSPRLTPREPAFRQAVFDTLLALPPQTLVSVSSPYGQWHSDGQHLIAQPVTPPSATLSPASPNAENNAARVQISVAGGSDTERAHNFAALAPRLQAPGLHAAIAGYPAVAEQLNEQIPHDIKRAELLTLPLVFLLCLLIFGSVVSALMPTMIAALAIVGSLGIIRLLTHLTDVSTFSANIITMLGMGLAVDYSLFIISRFREELPRRVDTSRPSVNAALSVTMATAGRTVLFSGLVVAASLAGLALFPQNFLISMAFGGVSTVLLSMACALTVLPATLALLGPRLDAGRVPWRRTTSLSATTQRHRQPHGWGNDMWTWIAHSVLRRPVVVLVASSLFLLTLALPFRHVEWGGIDHRVLPASSPSYQDTQTVENLFGGPTSSAYIVLRGADSSGREDYLRRLQLNVPEAQLTGWQRHQSPTSTEDLLTLRWAGTSQTPQSQKIVEQLRAVSAPSHTTALITGASARTLDLIDSLRAHLPWMLAFVALVMLILLFFAFGSLVLPIKAILMNLISIGASFGVVTWIFQDGHLSGVLGFIPTGYLDATQPITMLAILFGLSMDYEVFLLSRMREQWQRTGNTSIAIATGLQRTGAIITSAALLLAIVIGGFTTSSITLVKMIGVGMLVAIVLDATVVRALLVPSLMQVMGDLNWWAPPILARWWLRYGHAQYQHLTGPRSLYAQRRRAQTAARPAAGPGHLSALQPGHHQHQ